MTPDDAQTPTGFADQEYGLPCAEALLAGTMALMTGHAEARCAGQRRLLAHKVADNLQLLARHAKLSPAFRAMLAQLQPHWTQCDTAPDNAAPLPPQALWHRAPQAVQ